MQIAQIKVGARPRCIAFTPDGKRAYVACERSNEVAVRDVLKLAVIEQVPAGVRSNGALMAADGR